MLEGFNVSALLALLPETSLTQAGFSPCIQHLLADISFLWYVQHKQGFIFITACNFISGTLALSGPSCRYCPATRYLASKALSLGGRLYNPFTLMYFRAIKPEQCELYCQVQLNGCNEPWTFESHFPEALLLLLLFHFFSSPKTFSLHKLKAESGRILHWFDPSVMALIFLIAVASLPAPAYQ